MMIECDILQLLGEVDFYYLVTTQSRRDIIHDIFTTTIKPLL